MWIWDYFTKAKVTRTKDQLRIRLFSVIIPLFINIFGVTICSGLLENGDISFLGFSLIVLSIFLASIFVESHVDIDYTSIFRMSIKAREGEAHTFTYKPFFIDLLVKPNHQSIRVAIIESRKIIGSYLLKDKTDLAQLIDGLEDLLDVELMENIKLSKSELLNFRSKNTKVAIPTDLIVKRVSEILSITSIYDTRQPITFNFKRNVIRTATQNIDLSSVTKLLIQPSRTKLKIKIVLFSGEKVQLLKHNSAEFMIIRDAKWLLNIFKNRQELRNIEIELIEKT